ncbi:MAG: putative helicase [Verrucomicrobiaceae bacterium]|nr:putative helicase [Verrucomicrobiaceae bacterium]
MNDLLATLQGINPPSLWEMASKPLLTQGAGLLAVGDITNLSWTGEDQLDVEFPDRLATIVHRLRLNGQRIEGACDCSAPQPCKHHLASFMLCMHLLKDFGAFGRFPNRAKADRLKARLLREDERAVMAPQPQRKNQRHVLIRLAEAQLFGYRDSFSHQVKDGFASLPGEVQPFCTLWGSPDVQEKAFWEWFNSPKRTLPVFIETDGKVLAVEPATVTGWQGSVALELSPQGLTMRRRLACNGEVVVEDFLPVRGGLIYFPATKWLIRLPNDQSWQEWEAVRSTLGDRHIFNFMKRKGDAAQSQVQMPIDLEEWNAAGFSWWGTSPEPRRFPSLEWLGQPVSFPPGRGAHGCIGLSPSQDRRLLRVEVTVVDDGTVFSCDDTLHIEDALQMLGNESSLLSAKSRREAILGTLYECWLEDGVMERRALLRTLEAAPCFKIKAQAKAAVRMVKQVLKDGGSDQPLLGASTEKGWFTVSNLGKAAQQASALTRTILGAISPDEVRDYADDEFDSGLVALVDKALPRLSQLQALCEKHGVELTYSDQPIEVISLDCKVTVQKADALDWFEMKPEVKGAGRLIPQDDWERMLSVGHVIDNDSGAMRVIDVKSMDGLSRLQHLLGRQKQELQKPGAKGTDLGDLVKIPRMRVLDWLLLSKHGIECELPASERQVLDSLMSFESLERAPVPASIHATLRDYQVAGYSWMAFLYRHGFGACLADDMGLGKTLQTLTLLAAIHEGSLKPLGDEPDQKRPHLLVVPPTLLFNWENEVKVFCPGLPVYEYTGKGRSLIGIKEGIVITTYDIARRDIETLRNALFDCVIFDEAQNVKNMGGERSRAMRQLQGRFKLVLTGTPMENHVGEYYSIIDLAVPGLFGDYKTFMDAMKQPNGIFNPLDRAKPFVLRRTKDKILKELPPKVVSDMHLELSEEQKRFYTRAVGEVRQEVLAAFEDKTAQQAGIVALAALTRLRQICVSPALIDPEHTEISPKFQHLLDKVAELREEGHSALIFSQFTKALDQLEKHLKEAGVPFQRLDGSTPQQKRKTLVEAFQSGKGPALFLISLKAGGAGLNLTRASYVFHLDPWWNPAVENQASDRAHRMGQKSTVFIQRLLMLHTVEEKIMQLKARKSELFDRVLSGAEGDRATGAVITKEDFKFLLG